MGDSLNLAIGQGNVLVSPLQMARLVAAIGNNGTLYQPQLVLKVQSGEEAPTYSMFTSFIPASEGTASRNVLMGYLAVDSNAGSEKSQVKGAGPAVHSGGVRRAAEGGELLFECDDFLAEYELCGLEYVRHCGQDLIFDREILLFQVNERY